MDRRPGAIPGAANPDTARSGSRSRTPHLLTSDERGFDFRLLHLLGPFDWIVGGRFRKEARVTVGGRTLAAATLRVRAYGPRQLRLILPSSATLLLSSS